MTIITVTKDGLQYIVVLISICQLIDGDQLTFGPLIVSNLK